MIDICMALDQSVSPHTGVRTIQNTGVFWQAVFQPPRPYSLFSKHGCAAKTLISHPQNTASYEAYKTQDTRQLFMSAWYSVNIALITPDVNWIKSWKTSACTNIVRQSA